MNRERSHCFAGVVAVLTALTAHAADQVASNSPPAGILLLDNMGRVVNVSTNAMPLEFQPATRGGVERQIPAPQTGASLPPEILQRFGGSTNGFQFLSAAPPLLMPYLASQDEYGNTAIRPGALFNVVPLEGPVSGGKYWLSDYGFRYSLQQTYTYASLHNIKQGNSELNFYTLDLKSKWNVYTAPDSGTAGWISFQVEANENLGPLNGSNNTFSAKSNLGTLTDPTGISSDTEGFRIPELAWQQSLRHGEIVMVAGMVSQRNYLDANAYADSGRSKFLNSALIHSGVMPLAEYNYGVNVQWQPLDEWYAMVGGSVGTTAARNAPWTDYNWDSWSAPVEFGYAPRDFFGLGPGVYRVQPFWAGANNTSGGGIGFNLQQQLGAQSPLGWFGRFGFANAKVAGDAADQIGTGLVLQGPFKHLLLQRTSNDLLGTGFVWSEPSYTTKKVDNENEYVWETLYALQLTPTIKIQTDYQLIWSPIYHANTARASVFQIQVAVAW